MDGALPQIDLGASIAYAAPAGAAERGSRVSDTTVGIAPLRLDGAYAFTRKLGVAAAVSYAPAIPTLCQSASDCIASVGSDLALSVRARFQLPSLGTIAPRLDVGVGYEWLTTKLVDSGARSTRAYNGPLLGLVEVQAPILIGRNADNGRDGRLGTRWTIAPIVGAAIGMFTNESLETNLSRQSGSVPDRTVHAWLTVGVRLGFEP